MEKIGILMGGFSSEREVSLKSGFAVEKALTRLGYQVIIIDFGDVQELTRKLRSINVDCIFNAYMDALVKTGECRRSLMSLKSLIQAQGLPPAGLQWIKLHHERFLSKIRFLCLNIRYLIRQHQKAMG